MTRFFKSYEDGFPFLIYYLSLFITTSYYSLLCNNIYSTVIFVIASIIFLSVKVSSGKRHRMKRIGAFGLNIISVITILFSVLSEIGIAVNIFGLASDADSGKAELSCFAAIICIFAFLVALQGITSLRSLACLGVIIPPIVIIPCIIAIFKFGAVNIFDYLKTSNPLRDILGGLAAFSVLVPDIGILYEYSVSEKKCSAYNASIWSRGAVIFIAFTCTILGILYGRNMNTGLSSSLLSTAGLCGGMGFDETLLIVFAFCLVLRLGMKMVFIYGKTMNFLKKQASSRAVTLTAVIAVASLGSYIVTKNNITAFIYAQAILNSVSFIVIPFITNICLKKLKVNTTTEKDIIFK